MSILASVHIEGEIIDTSGIIITSINTLPKNSTSGVISHFKRNLNAFEQILIPVGAKGVIISCESVCDTKKYLQGASTDSFQIQIFTDLTGFPQNSGTCSLLFSSPAPASFWIFSDNITSPGAADPGRTQFFFF